MTTLPDWERFCDECEAVIRLLDNLPAGGGADALAPRAYLEAMMERAIAEGDVTTKMWEMLESIRAAAERWDR